MQKLFGDKFGVFQILENISEGCFYLDTEWNYKYINNTAAELLNLDDRRDSYLGRSIWGVFPHFKNTYECRMICEALDEKRELQFEFQTQQSKKWLQVRVFPDTEGALFLFSDITEKKHRDRQKEYYEKLKLIGEMSAGVAHEVRNPLTSVKGFLQVMSQNNELVKYKDIYQLMVDEIDRVNGIITEFLETAKDRPSQKEVCNLNDIIRTLLPLLETRGVQEGKNITLELNDIGDLTLDPNEIRQLLLNMINNSFDAMLPGKKVKIITYQQQDKVVMTIQDEGQGIPPKIIDQIANPFVTTKETGTGLGLPICFSIAERNNGAIDYSSSEQGTIFNIRFLIEHP